MQETQQTTKATTHLNKRTKIESLVLMLAFSTPLLVALGRFQWTELPIFELLIIGIMLITIGIGLWRLAKQVILVLKAGPDTDYRER
ncbi:hypothetical protein H3M12_03995 [Levilactobacillus suantsaii]|uniref:Uncharacterized protein n=2 Tax=Levilactobacillus suantsaii TaxID=2292255 RepID=A0A4Q0VGS3_9LACO|nr:hypothetical protein H3M12_03995 [Levilactobacillus suantsaii]RXI76711.1 hypothetical protein DXH47_10210 [Levilactobacillus suantsaii]